MDNDDLEWLHENREDIADLLESRKRWKWLGSMTKAVAGWLVAIGAAWVMVRTGLTDFINRGE